jgi:hypothetical protein
MASSVGSFSAGRFLARYRMASRRFTLVLTLLTAFCGCRTGETTPIPDALVGVWTTAAPKYSGRYFEISKQAVGFGTGDYNVDAYPIVGVETAPKNNRTFYLFSLRTPEGDPYRFAFYYEPTDGGKIQLENQTKITWMKARTDE